MAEGPGEKHPYQEDYSQLFFVYVFVLIHLFIFGCVGSLLLCAGFL